MENSQEISLKTYFPVYKTTFKWTFESYSKLPDVWSEKSEEFKIEPDSNWYVKFVKKAEIYLYLCRNGSKNIKVNYEVLILNSKNEILHKNNGSYENQKEVDIVPEFTFSDLLKKQPEDQIIFKISITVEISEPSTVCSNLTTPEVSHIRLKTLSADLKKLFNNSIKSDIKFNIGGETLPAHKSILVARSDVFARMFQEGMAEENDSVVNVEDVDMPTMKTLLSFLYTGELEESDFDAILEVFRAADKYAVADLREDCARVLASKMSMENVSKVLYVADMHHHVALKEKAMQFIAVHYKPIKSELHEKS